MLVLIVAVIVLWVQVSDQARRLRALEEQLQALQVRETARLHTSAPALPPIAIDQPAAATTMAAASGSNLAGSNLDSVHEVDNRSPQSGKVGQGVNFLAPYWAGRAKAAPHLSRMPTAPANIGGGQPFAVLGGLLTLLGLGAVLSQLVRAGFFTPQMQLAAAFALAALLYALGGRARSAVGAVLRGLGYGIAALAFGAMYQTGTLPLLAVLGLTGVLSLLVGWHAWQRREPLTLLVALSGATLATWLLADDLARQLGTLGMAQAALLAVFGAALWSIWRGQDLASGKGDNQTAFARWPLNLLPLLLPLGTVGLYISAVAHELSGEGWLWLLMGAAGLLGLTATAPAPAEMTSNSDQANTENNSTAALHAAATLALALATAAALLWPVGGRPLLPSALGLGLVTLAALVWRLRRFAAAGQTQQPNKQPDLLRDALTLAALSLGAGMTERWVGMQLNSSAAESLGTGLRLLPYALLAALYGRWTDSQLWQRGGAALGAWMLLGTALDLALSLSTTSLNTITLNDQLALGLGAGAAVGSALRLTAARSSGVLLATAAFALVVTCSEDVRQGFLPLLGAAALAFWGGLRWGGRLLWLGGWALALGLLAACGRLLNFAETPPLTDTALNWLQLGMAAAGLVTLSVAPTLQPAWAELGREMRLDNRRWGAGLEALAVAFWLLGSAFFLETWLHESAAAMLLTGALAAGLALLLPRLPLRSAPWLPQVLLAASVLSALTAPQWLAPEPERLGLGSGWLVWVLATATVFWFFGAVPKGMSRRVALLPDWGLLLVGAGLAQSAGGLLSLTLGLPLGSLYAGLMATGLLLLTGLVGLWWAYRSEQRSVWWLGLALFGLGAIKLVLIDLDGLGLSARGLGLTLVGLLLLGIGQLAPEEKKAED